MYTTVWQNTVSCTHFNTDVMFRKPPMACQSYRFVIFEQSVKLSETESCHKASFKDSADAAHFL